MCAVGVDNVTDIIGCIIFLPESVENKAVQRVHAVGVGFASRIAFAHAAGTFVIAVILAFAGRNGNHCRAAAIAFEQPG